ncbi:hypothetical protein A2382_01625 [Candidatus Woesebacteria bacterium RIFOXYB1_FULL_38_16]|uniref:Glutamyl-tRNA amidotransferase n=1 Tax=Candidatus Woesebacteria bacterium RIFOXYB1_FULL_38_16 TaxID=1802538 RepID=A0A1F8CUV7_9BACT|nr:MAG: hypothetical protein A2191_03205 [Candidatus Woesebacteria bacterium RIFOXYA1_FULL_38_9]OGM80123.1 MAG: hypothetical protein A2382_01625 [Candidatus Woesebacteria bacterium RIFOXYB1_FULL_38_16]
MITEKLSGLIKEALKDKDETRLSTLRLLYTSLHNAQIDKRGVPLSQDEEILIVKKEVKKRRDAIEIYEKANETGRVKKEKEELEILSTFLPPEMDETKLKEIVSQTIKDLSAEGMKDMGKVIGAVMAKTSGQADGAKVSEIVRSLLS